MSIQNGTDVLSIMSPTDRSVLLFDPPAGLSGMRLSGFDCNEELSRLFRASLVLRSENPWPADDDRIAGALLGSKVSFGFRLADGSERWFHGLVHHVSGTSDPFALRADVGPWLWELGRRADCRVHADMTVQEVVTEVFENLGFGPDDFEWRLTQTYPKYEYCIQHRETTLNFVLRLLEQEGISFTFAHGRNTHKLILTDDPNGLALQTGGDPARVSLRPNETGSPPQTAGAVHSWECHHSLRPARYTLNGRNWRTPKADLLASEATAPPAAVGRGEIYDLGEFSDPDQARRYVRVRMEEEEAQRQLHTGGGDVRMFRPAMLFGFDGAGIPLGGLVAGRDGGASRLPPPPGTFLLTSVQHHAQEGAGGQPSSYGNTFTCVPADILFRPARITPKPMIAGVVSAVVVGDDGRDVPKEGGREVLTDDSGRVRIRLWWDRRRESQPPVWVRVSHPWAGAGFGGWFPPRIGQEVLVAFEDGDPDHPCVMGSMYAGGTDLPFGPAERATLVGLRTHSSPDDSRAHGNELSFADEAGREELRMFAQRDMNVRVQRDGRTVVGNDLFHFVTGNQMGRVGKDRRTLVDGNATEKTAGDWALAVGGKAVIDAAGGLVIDGGGCRLRLGPSGFEVELGSNYIVISADGVRVNGQLVKLNCAGAAPNIGAANVPAPEIPEPPPRAGGK